ncbi:pyridoxal phosphate-dependent aminotransferase family protein [Cellulophaga sp. HaHaR_3_176]|uniref:aminotransferase class I/II-fold pyridoxal phosphate-dependent enzyme n=1 Tax=Cellulophaga sp. HaHaR_3_176 TaxID=1942464 RepID=UPI001C1FC052|nr:aminotransferase class I/II-fold pyridoxal phosphate-dependent enzyme [Cellulophaga sp. HaHaR_3_176]QWX82687.1 pyridoxal phosphate-dependent aminotransferase family protein [Cellulophaga sp. HaHaR_3_176]
MVNYIDSFPGREISINNEKHLYFGGTSYLGLQLDEEFQHLYINNLKKYGTNYGASRKSNIRISIFDQAEDYLANLVGSEAAVTMSSGYLAGQFVAQSLLKSNHKLFYAPNTHSALYLSDTSKPYVTFSALNIALRDHIDKNKKTIPVVFLDAVDFSGANYPNFDGLQQLPLNDIILIVDDSHGIGIVGENGGGVFETVANLNPKELIVCCSLGKGFGVQGGAIFGSQKRINALVDTDFFGGSSPASPANLASILYGENIYTSKRVLLDINTQLFIKSLGNNVNFKHMPNHPAFSFSNEELTTYLEDNKIIITSFRYPNEDSNLMSRIVISAAHTKKDILKICEIINSFYNS